MDGNGRWATKRLMPRIMGHRAGAKAVRRAIDYCVRHRINTLSLFALSVENFSLRPQKEVEFLLELFAYSLEKNIAEIIVGKHRNGAIGSVKLYFDEQRVSFKNLEQSDYAGEVLAEA